MLHLILFLMFGAVCAAGAVNVVAQTHPINSALSLVVVMGSLAAEYLLLGAEFLAAVQVIVYAGAIMVLFLFAVMTIRPGRDSLPERKRFIYPAAIFLCLILATELALAVVKSIRHVVLIVPPGPRDASGIGHLMFSTYLYPFEITSLLLVAALVGVMALAGKERR